MTNETTPLAPVDFSEIISEHYKDLTKSEKQIAIISVRTRKNLLSTLPVSWPPG